MLGETYMKKCFIGVYSRSVILTYLGAAAAIFGMTVAHSLRFAVCCLILAGVCDLFDGKVASMCDRTDREKEFGIQIDSLADTVSFVVYPVMICKLFIFKSASHPINLLFFISCVLYIIAGIGRLGWFNVITKEERGVFHGLPVTSIAIIFPIFYLIFFILGRPLNTVCVSVLLLVISLLFVTDFKMKKPGKLWYLIASVIAVLAIALILSLKR